MIHIVWEYNTHFNEMPNLTTWFPTITRNFSNRWHPSETNKHLYLSNFSISEWNTLAPEEKTNHTLRDCQVCQTKYQYLSIPCSNFVKASASKLALTRFDYVHTRPSKWRKKNMTLPHPFQTELNHISAEVKQVHKFEEMHTQTQRWKAFPPLCLCVFVSAYFHQAIRPDTYKIRVSTWGV